MGAKPSYTEEEILAGLREHLIINKCSKYSLHNPITWQGVLKRMEKSEEFAIKVNTIVAEHNALWEQIGIDALLNNDEKFNVPLFKMYAGNKKSFQSYEVNELEQRLEILEDAQNKN